MMPLMFRVYVPPRDLEKSRQRMQTTIGDKMMKLHILKRYVPGPYVLLGEEDFQILKLEETMRTGEQFE